MHIVENEKVTLTILMPCLNEERTIEACIAKARRFMDENNISGEILIADNGSNDRSVSIARKNGARVITEPRKGYGSALMAGLANSSGKYIILGDCDMTYDFYHIEGLYRALKSGSDMVIGDRLNNKMERGAMSLSHHIGVRLLSLCARIKFKVKVHDFHCGLRGISRRALEQVEFRCTGMEFATEFIAEGAAKGLSIEQIPIKLYKGVIGRKPHLRTIPDGWRHLKYIMSYPRE